MSSRTEILSTIRQHHLEPTPLPELEGDWILYDDPLQQFTSVLESVGGQCYVIDSPSEIPGYLEDLTGEDKQVVSCVPGAFDGRFDLSKIDDPHELQDVDLSILPGQLAVAENGAVWVETADVLQRTLYFLSQHLVLVVPLASLVSNMHQAYEQIQPLQNTFGVFISGPSKTADIEQSLVKGAHGARTLKVFLVRD